jgi:winged helix domain-containing protein
MILEFDLQDSGRGGAASNHHLLSAPLKLDEHIINFILGSNEIDSRIRDFSKLLERQEEEQQEFPRIDLYSDLQERIVRLIENWEAKQEKDNGDNHDSVRCHIEHLRPAPIEEDIITPFISKFSLSPSFKGSR